MGPSPGDQQKVLLILGTLMLVLALLASIFAAVSWYRKHPGELRRLASYRKTGYINLEDL